MNEQEEVLINIDLTEEEIIALTKMAENRGLSVDSFVSIVLSKYCSL